ncbi:MAG TPA: YbaB/EbfC family nucleoid-associated protein [Anaerolineaceae bacterium]
MAKGFNRPKGMPGGGARGGGSSGMGGGGGAGGAGMMNQIKKLQEQMEVAQAQLADETVTATVGGGAIKVVMTGDQRCKSVSIDPEMLKDADAEMLQDMLLSCVNMALDQSRQLQSERLGPLAGGLPF